MKFNRRIYWCQLNQLPKQEWAEYFDGPTGTVTTIKNLPNVDNIGFLLMNHFLREDNDDLNMFKIKFKINSVRDLS